ncbi:MAG: hypothetical protein EKK48_29275 [Candidatus Melainabacteria bacterium]|nr:MAG: hypothetical protein EKK48_29275 [Candidatus Melainabacteria bacterium]
MMLKLKSNFIPLLSMVLFLVSISLASCASKEQQLKERQETLEKFVVSLTKNVFDRNPVTIKESMGQLMRLQLSEGARNKLQAEGKIPDTELDVLKIIDDNQNAHITNKVDVDSVHPTGPVDQNLIPFKVVAKTTTLQNGQPTDSKVFNLTVVCQLTPEMGGYPRCTEIDGLPGGKEPAKATGKSSSNTPISKRKRRH